MLGDARLTLEKAAAQSLDYLVIDAFSSDAIPMHLLTVEAIAMYLSKLAPEGVVAVHVSNRYLDLVPALTATLDRSRVTNRLVVRWKPEATHLDATPSHVVLFAKNEHALARARGWSGASDMTPALASAQVSPWTDDYSDILSALVAKWRQ